MMKTPITEIPSLGYILWLPVLAGTGNYFTATIFVWVQSNCKKNIHARQIFSIM